ncbi:hypothetical protein [Actinoplanes sp. NPDC051859]|uniref:hypothetical protein n=1 Tax=Actinoplanes sp. NPDC051859 TaxID=3363909 RepID=UPI0037A600C0
MTDTTNTMDTPGTPDAADELTDYLDTLRALGAHGVRINDALIAAHVASDTPARVTALTALHHAIRAMAAATNAAIAVRVGDGPPGTAQ